MMRSIFGRCAVALMCGVIFAGAFGAARGGDEVTEKADESAGEKYTLRYQFQVGQSQRWNVEHLKNVRTTVQGTTHTAELTTRSVKRWTITEVDDDGGATFENSVESVDLLQKQSGREEVRFNSDENAQPPPGFEQFAATLGQPLYAIHVDARGNVTSRTSLCPTAAPSKAQLTIPLPNEPAAIGHTWYLPDEVEITLKSGMVLKVKTRQRFVLEEVSGHVATIGVETQVLTPVNDPEAEIHLIDLKTRGKVRFDLEAGHVVSQQLDCDESVVNFNGEGSSMRSVSRFSETWKPEGVHTVALPKAAPTAK